MENSRDPSTTLPPPLVRSSRVDITRCSLKVTEGPDGGKSIDPLGEHTILGRDPWCDLAMVDPRTSRRHCEIVVEGEHVLVRDLESSNGTFVGDLRVREAYLKPNDVIRIGDSRIRLTIEQGKRRIKRSPLDPTGSLIGSGADMRRVFSLMVKAAPHDFPVAIYGEPGVGKTAVARAMISMGRRSHGPFVSLDCRAPSWEDFERVLFGATRGSDDDVVQTQLGKFEEALGGALMLDDVDETSMYIQHRTLEVLDHGRVRPVGSSTGFDMDCRLFVSARRPLDLDVTEGRFSRSLYKHFCALEFEIPPLRDRIEDIPRLASHFLALHATGDSGDEPSNPGSFSMDALRKLAAHSWPGNVAELKHVIFGAAAADDDTLIGPERIALGNWRPATEGPDTELRRSPEGPP